MMRRAATKTFSLTAAAALIAAPLAIAGATPASAATTALSACTPAALQAALTAGGSYDLTICTGKSVVISTPLTSTGTTTLSYTGAAASSPLLAASGAGTKSVLLQVNGGSLTLVGLTLTGITTSTDRTQTTEGGAAYVGSGATLILQGDNIANSRANGAVGSAGTNGVTGTPNGTSATGDSADGLGGGVYNNGTLDVINSGFTSDAAQGGAGQNGGNGLAGTAGTVGTASTDPTQPGGAGGNAGNGGNGGGATNGGNGLGGAIFNASTATLNLNGATFTSNAANGGKGGSGGNAANGGNGGVGGAGANATADSGAGGAGGVGGAGGNAGSAGAAGTPGAAIGGAVYNNGTANLNAAAFSKNAATGGAGGTGGNGADPGTGGAGGKGGNGANATTVSTTVGVAGGAGAVGGAVGATGTTSGNAAAGTNGGTAVGAAIYNHPGSTLEVASSTFATDTATGGAGGAGGAAGQPNTTTAVGGTGGTGGTGENGVTAGPGGAGGNGGPGANGAAAVTAGTGGNGGNATALVIDNDGGTATAGCLTTTSEALTGLAGGALGSGGAAGSGAPKTNGGAGGTGGATGTGALGAAGANGTAGANGSTGGGAAAVGSTGTAGSADTTVSHGTIGDLACAGFNPTAITATGHVGTGIPESVTVTNNGDTTFTVSGTTVTGTGSGDVSNVSNGCSGGIAHAATCTISLTVTPSAAGVTDTASLNLTDNGVGGSQSIPVSVTGSADASSMTIAALSSKITAGQGVTISTTLRDTVTNTVIPNATVYLFGETAGTKKYAVVATATTSSSGTAVVRATPTHKTTYIWVFVAKGSNGTGFSTTATVGVKQTVTISLQHASIRRGKTAVVYGTTNPADAGVKVTLQQLSHGKWRTAGATAKTKKQKLPNGKTVVGFILRAKATASGTYVLRVVASATVRDTKGISAKKSLRVA